MTMVLRIMGPAQQVVHRVFRYIFSNGPSLIFSFHEKPQGPFEKDAAATAGPRVVGC